MRRYPGITLIELLVSVAIIGLLIVATTVSIRSYLLRSDDAQRKTDLKKISQALEQYYNDRGGYPASLSGSDDSLITCGTNVTLNPYLKDVPCDPNGGSSRPYLYIREGNSHVGTRGDQVYRAYRLLTALQYSADPQIKEVGCPDGCGGKKADTTTNVPDSYNFGIAANTQLIQTP